MSARTVLATTTAGLMVAAGVGGYMFWNDQQQQRAQDDAAREAAVTFARAWSNRTLDKATYIGTEPAAAAANFATATAQLGNGNIRTSVQNAKRSGDTATADVAVQWTVPGGQTFSWTDPISLAKTSNGWGVRVTDRSLWHPKLQSNDWFVVKLDSGLRGEIKGKDGAAIMTNQTVYDILLDPTKATAASAASLERATGVSGLQAKLAAAKTSKSQATIPVITYRQDDFNQRESGLRAITGVVVSERQQPLASTRTFGQPLLGAVGPVTAEMIQKDPSTYRAGMYTGTSGLQRQYNSVLQAKGGMAITAHSDPGTSLFGTGAKNGTDVVITLDPTVQTAAESALAALPTGSVSALVAIDVPTGNVLAAASGPTYGLERAVTGRYAPGSTFKIATAYQLMKKGLKPDGKVACPQQTTVDGLAFRNFEGESIGDPTFKDDFAHSCNTAFVDATKSFGATDEQQGAAAFGVGGDWGKNVGVDGAYPGSVPTSTGATDTAAMAIGQGRIQVSPLALASMASAVARGSFVPPVVVTSPAPGGDRSPKPLDATVTASLKEMMRLTVTEGTATLMDGVPGGDVYAKTGTAEFAEGGKTGANAWLAGWQGTVAFAVLVADVPAGKGGGTVAAPVARDFLATLSRS